MFSPGRFDIIPAMDFTALDFETTGYENGVYVVKAGEQTMRFVVKH